MVAVGRFLSPCALASNGEPGAACARKNTMTATKNMVGMSRRSRRIVYLSMLAGLFLRKTAYSRVYTAIRPRPFSPPRHRSQTRRVRAGRRGMCRERVLRSPAQVSRVDGPSSAGIDRESSDERLRREERVRRASDNERQEQEGPA